MTARGDSLGCSRNPGSNYYAGLTHQSMIDLGADDAAKVSVFHSLWVGKAGANYYEAVRPSRCIGTRRDLREPEAVKGEAELAGGHASSSQVNMRITDRLLLAAHH